MRIYLILLVFMVASCQLSQKGDPTIGKRIYEEGILADGSLLEAVGEGGHNMKGAIISCAKCHRKSGFGSFEGSVYVPPITADYLFKDQVKKRADMLRSLYQEEFTNRHWAKIRQQGTRTAYTEANLAKAIIEGKSINGDKFDPIMPKYNLDEENLYHLISYLHSLENHSAEGLSQDSIHFAVIIAADSDPISEALFRQMIDTYVKWKNASVDAQLIRAKESPNYKDGFYDTYKKWNIHYWRLEGHPESWYLQLKRRYKQQAIFAILSGLSEDEWAPVHQFAERQQIPVFFPFTNWPVAQEEDYNLYFSEGFKGKMQSLANFLSYDKKPRIQVVTDKDALRRERNTLQQFSQLKEYSLEEYLKTKALHAQDQNVILWLTESQLAGIEWPKSIHPNTTFILPQIDDIPEGLSTYSVLSISPFTLPEGRIARNYRVKAWMRSRGIAIEDEALQLNTYFALSVVDFSLAHLVGHYSREYLIERVEHETENNLNPGIYPSLSLGPGQRFASKGNYILAHQKDKDVVVLGRY